MITLKKSLISCSVALKGSPLNLEKKIKNKFAFKFVYSMSQYKMTPDNKSFSDE